MISFWKRTVTLSFIFVMGNGPMNSNSCLEFFLTLDYNFFTNLVLVIIPSHVFSHVNVIDLQLFALPNVFPGGNMLDV